MTRPRRRKPKPALVALALALIASFASFAADAAVRATSCRAGTIERVDPRFDRVVARETTLECVADGFAWVEGPVWDATKGVLYFTDIPANSVHRLRPGGVPELFLRPAGYSGAAVFAGREPGANGLAIDAEGRLVLCEHGDRRVTRLEADGSRTLLADRYDGKRLNSPNDVVVARDGSLYFTDPPFGLPETYDDPRRELDFTAVFRRTALGVLDVVIRDLDAPNGIEIAPDGATLYVSNASRSRPVVMAYTLGDDGRVLGAGRVLFDASRWLETGNDVPDGMAVDAAGNVFIAGPGGVHVLAPDGTRLGLIGIEAPTSNVAIGEGGVALYITADTAVYRLTLSGRPDA